MPVTRRMRPLPRRSSQGFTLVEMIVVVFLLALAMLGILSVFDASARINKSESDIADAQGAVRYGIYSMTRAVRMAGAGGLYVTQAEQPPVGEQGEHPVCRSKPIKGELMTPRISIMSVPGRTGTAAPPTVVTDVSAGTLSYTTPGGVMPASCGSDAFRTACVTKRPPEPAIRMARVIE